MNLNLTALAHRIEGWLRTPLHSLLMLIIWTMFVMAALLAWVTIYSKIGYQPSFPFVKPLGSGLDLLYAIGAAALLYFIPRK